MRWIHQLSLATQLNAIDSEGGDMCSRYEAPDADQLLHDFKVTPEQEMQSELWPGYSGPFLRPPQSSDPHDEAAPPLEALVGIFGLLPFWAKDTKLARRTYNPSLFMRPT